MAMATQDATERSRGSEGHVDTSKQVLALLSAKVLDVTAVCIACVCVHICTYLHTYIYIYIYI